ncbi:TPA: hypothetical protein R9B53_003830 [Escherichia coli]|nr:hypothetical protein [Escherichia coli]
MHTSHGKAISCHSIPSSISSFTERKGRHESIRESFSAIQTTSTELEIADIVLKIQRENRLNIFSRLIDIFFNDSRKQHARDHMVTLAIADAYKEYINHLPGDLSPVQQQDIRDKLSQALGKAIGHMDYMQGHHFSTVEECASGNDSNLLIVFYVQIMPDDFVMQLHRF